jgi:bifunctional DNase/RNase
MRVSLAVTEKYPVYYPNHVWHEYSIEMPQELMERLVKSLEEFEIVQNQIHQLAEEQC